MSKSKVFGIFCFMLVLLLTVTGTGFAQDRQPLQPSGVSFNPHIPLEKYLSEKGQLGERPPFLSQTSSGVDSNALTLGAPGLSFRYIQTIGTTSVPYLVDNSHLNNPRGLFVDTGDNLFVAEREGSRVQKFDSSGNFALTLGHAGQPWAHDDFLGCARDVAVRVSDGHIWVIGCPMLKEFDSSGVWVRSFPDPNPWETGSDNAHFNDPWGVAFGAGGYLYVADSGNHRIQVFDISGGAPAYVTTVGTTGITQTDNTGFNYPKQIAFDSLNRMYVMDLNNFRVQRCTSSAPWTIWSCSTFYGETGVQGNDLTHMSWSDGIGIDSNDNIFIADGSNVRVLKCNTSAVCTEFAGENGVTGSDNAHFFYPDDVAIDSSGNVYVSDSDNHRVQKFSNLGIYQSTIGITLVPYLTDNSHFNKPWGIAIAPAPDNSMYILEYGGYRLIKLNSSGVFQWSVGQVGVWGSDNTHFGGLEGSPAVDTNGRVYVGDTGNNRVQIFNSNGSYFATLGTGWGTGNYEFECPTEISISPVNGDIYVTDQCNYRVQVFTSSRVYKATLGVTGTAGSDNLHFSMPRGMTVDNSGNIFVADGENYRVQKCQLIGGAPGYACSTFAGETGVSGSDFGHIGYPLAVKVDATGRVYVADEWNSRVQVFDASGAYLTTIAGAWGTNNGSLIGPSGLALDSSGNVYVTDRDNHRIQKFTPGVPGWTQSNLNGFGDRTNTGAASLQVFGTYLYAGLGNSNGGQVWRTADTSSWTQINNTGFGNINNTSVQLGTVFNGYLYAGTWNQSTGCEVYRTSDGLSWSPVKSGGFNNSNNIGIGTMAVFNNDLYVSTYNASTGPEVWRTSNGTTWSQANVAGFGDSNNVGAWTMAVFGNALYVGTQNFTTGAELWRTPDGVTWEQVNTDGFGNANNQWPQLTIYNTYLYVGIANDSTDTYVGTGTQIWRSANGTTWDQVVGDGFGDSTNGGSDVLTVFNGSLYSATYNYTSGTQIRKTTDGINWTKTALDGFGDINNYSTHGSASFKNSLFLATPNDVNGGQIWRNTMTTFTDVPSSYWSWGFIERLYAAGITGGCSTVPLSYCPTTPVTRAQMAVFLLRGMHGSTYTPPAATGTKFNDVPLGTFGAAWIEQLAAEGITSGCGGGNYCPNTPVSRAQMAIFLVRAKHGSTFVPPTATGIFADVPIGSFGANFIEQLVTDAITSGCGSGNFCPNTTVKRDSMAVFLVKTFNLP